MIKDIKVAYDKLFQHAAARRRLIMVPPGEVRLVDVSTRSRPKAAESCVVFAKFHGWFQHAAARRRLSRLANARTVFIVVSTRSRPKAADKDNDEMIISDLVSTRSRPKAAEPRPASVR